jgi:PAS domain S-box-containing protein
MAPITPNWSERSCLNFFTDLTGKISIRLFIPLIFVVSLIFIYVQIYHVWLPKSEKLEREKHIKHLQGTLSHIQATLSDLMVAGLESSILQELKLQPIRDPEIEFAAVFSDAKELLFISHRKYRSTIHDHVKAIMENPDFTDACQYEKPFIYADNERHMLHGIVPLNIASMQNALSYMNHSHLLVKYSYDSHIEGLRANVRDFFIFSTTAAVVLFLLVTLLLHHLMLKQLIWLQKSADKIRDGDYDVTVETAGFKEIRQIIRSFNSMTAKTTADIEEIRRTHKALMREKEAAQNYLDIVGVMILVLDSDYRVRLINQRGCEIIGYEAHEVIGKHWMEHFIPERFRNKVAHVGDSVVIKENLTIRYFENPVLTKHGEERLIAWRNTALTDENGNPIGILTSGEDITEIRKTQLQLEESESFFRNVFASVEEAIYILFDNVVVDCNAMSTRLFERPKEEIVGSKINDLCTIQCKNASFQSYIGRALEGDSVTSKCFISLDKDFDHVKIVQMTMTPMGNDMGKIICVMRDITEELEKDRLLIMNSRQAQMGEMISMIAHQWRQPLATISAITTKMTLNRLMGQIDETSETRHIETIEQQVKHLSQTISDFRDFFRPDKPKESVSLHRIISDTLDLLDHALKSDGIKVQIIGDPDIIVNTYRNEVLQVCMTLIKNSLDAFTENQVTRPTITIDAQRNGHYGNLLITDNAGGIDPAIIADIFLPYFTTKDDKGTGLGLYMSKTVIEEHCEGLLQVSSDGEQTTFTMALPLNEETS